MRIECGTTRQRRNRIILVIIVCGVFAAWFAYDGWYKYPREQAEERVAHSNSSIYLQKVLAVGMGIATLVGVIHLVRVSRQRFALNEEGLHLAGRAIGWEQMQGFEHYDRRGWVDLTLADGGKVRLDNYKIELCDEMIDQICTRRNLPNPLPAPEADPPPEEGEDLPPTPTD